jgi:hypothetical protein
MKRISSYKHALIIRFLKFFSANILSVIVPLSRQRFAKLDSGSHSVTSLITALKSAAYLFSGLLLSMNFEPIKCLMLYSIFLIVVGGFALYKIINYENV